MLTRHNKLQQLLNTLAECYPEKADAFRLIRQAGLDLKSIAFSDTPIKTWSSALEAAIDEGQLAALVEAARKDRPGVAELQRIADILTEMDLGPSPHAQFVDETASLFELQSYEVERGRIVDGHRLDLFLELRKGALVYQQAVACHEHDVQPDDVSRLADLVRALRRERTFRGTQAVLVCRADARPKVHAYAESQDVTILTQSKLESELLDGRGYARRLIQNCEADDAYPMSLYVDPYI